MDQHEILADLKRVALDLGHVPTREEYLVHGKFSKERIRLLFGSFTACLQAAGFKEKKETPTQKKYERELTQYDQGLRLRKKFESEILPWVGKYERDRKDSLIIMHRTDDHAQWVDPFCDGVFWDVAQRIQPDVISFGGDTVDFYQASFHSKNPRRSMTLQSEINFVKKHFWEVARQVCPNAQIDWLLGNHEMRLFRYLSDVAPALSSLDCLQFDQLFDLKLYEINLVARPTFLSPGLKERENFKIYQDCFVTTHGTSTGQHPGHAELKRFGKSGTSGHVHRHTVATHRDLNGTRTWTTNGAMCTLKSGEEYIPDLVNWDQGFTIIHIHRGQVTQEYVSLNAGFSCIGGVYYYTRDYGPNSSLP